MAGRSQQRREDLLKATGILRMNVDTFLVDEQICAVQRQFVSSDIQQVTRVVLDESGKQMVRKLGVGVVEERHSRLSTDGEEPGK